MMSKHVRVFTASVLSLLLIFTAIPVLADELNPDQDTAIAEAPAEDDALVAEDTADPDPLNEQYRFYANIAGSNRYATAVEIARTGWGQGEQPHWMEVVIVTGQKFPDALAANAYCGVAHAPLLLSSLDKLSKETYDLLDEWDWRMKKVTVIGKEFKAGFYADLQKLGYTESKGNLQIIGGADRYETAEEVTKATRALADKEGMLIPAVAVATGQAPFDAMSFSPWAYKKHIPILLVKNGIGSASTKELIAEFPYVYLLGSEEVVSISNISHWQEEYDGALRLFGNNRYETSQAIAYNFMKALDDLPYDRCGFADGTLDHYVDALAAGPLQGGLGGAILLTCESESSIKYVKPWVEKNMAGDPQVQNVYFYGWAAEGKSNEYNRLVSWIESKD